MPFLLAFAKKKPPVDVSAHIDTTTLVLWLAFGLVCAFFALRPELWRRLWFRRVDPRPAALMRILFGAVIFWTFVDFAALIRVELFTDEGLYMTEMARSKYGGRLRNLWDPEHGFEHWYDIFDAMWAKFSILHLRSDPAFVNAVFGAFFVSCTLMILGKWTRISTVVTWFLANNLYNYSPVFYTGGDTALRTFFFLCMFLRWGEAYSLDSLSRRRKAIRDRGVLPAPRLIPAWPTYIIMVQFTCIYFATGLLKSGNTWFNGSALYYAMNLDHFYRVQATGLTAFLHYLGLLQAGTYITHYWERLFPLAVVGVMLRGWEADRLAGLWPRVAPSRKFLSWLCLVVAWLGGAYLAVLGVHYFYKPGVGGVKISQTDLAVVVFMAFVALPPLLIVGYRWLRARHPRGHVVLLDWILGKRVWLVLGLLFHIGIDLTLNVGTFVQAMIAPYFAWVVGKDVERFWRWLYWDAAKPGVVGRPRRRKFNVLARVVDRMAYRLRPPAHYMRYGPDERVIKEVAGLRLWDLAERFDFEIDASLKPGQLRMHGPGGRELSQAEAAKAIAGANPVLWWVLPLAGAGLGQMIVFRIVFGRGGWPGR